MTWSITAHDPATGAFGIAVATCAFAVGAACPHWRAGVGAVSTQSITNRYLGPAVLDAMARGLSPRLALESALAGDEGRHLRQVHAVDAQGRSAAWTGRHCVEWCGDEAGPGLSLAGNMLAGHEVLPATRAAFEVAALAVAEMAAVAARVGAARAAAVRAARAAVARAEEMRVEGAAVDWVPVKTRAKVARAADAKAAAMAPGVLARAGAVGSELDSAAATMEG
jgi:uncharacterized Ntn-hydrolase superfamily protein